MANQDIEKLKSKSGLHLLNYMKKRKVSSFPEELRDYYHFRDYFLHREYAIKRNVKRLKGIADRSTSIERRRSLLEDMSKLSDDLKWIKEGFFDLSKEDQMNPPNKNFFQSEHLKRY